MRKTLLLFAFLFLLVVNCSVFGAGRLNVVKENFHIVSSWGLYGYAYAKVENVGDKPIKVNAGVLEVFDEKGDIITSSDRMNAYVAYLNPGEYTYVRTYSELEDSTKSVGDYSLTLTGKSVSSSSSIRLPCETELKLNVGNGWLTYNYMYALVTNNTDGPLYGIEIAFALLDEEENILYIASDELYSNTALTPGSSMIFRMDISSSFIDYFKKNNLKASKVDAIAYVLESSY